jgi:hypothetical protein
VKRTHYFLFLMLTAVVIVVVVSFARLKTVQPVIVVCCGITNDPGGKIAYCFQVTNSMAADTHVSYAVEVLHNGVWFNALPQPKGVGDLVYLPAKNAIFFAVPAPIGRAEEGLRVQPDPPGEKWRTYCSYYASRYPPGVRTAMEGLGKFVGNKNGQTWRSSYSPEMSFVPANPQGGANGTQPFNTDTNRTSATAASRLSP